MFNIFSEDTNVLLSTTRRQTTQTQCPEWLVWFSEYFNIPFIKSTYNQTLEPVHFLNDSLKTYEQAWYHLSWFLEFLWPGRTLNYHETKIASPSIYVYCFSDHFWDSNIYHSKKCSAYEYTFNIKLISFPDRMVGHEIKSDTNITSRILALYIWKDGINWDRERL